MLACSFRNCQTPGEFVAQNPERSVRSPQSIMLFGVVVVALILITEADARAYVDPGTGSYLFQLAIAGGLAGIYTVRRYWHALTDALRRRFGRKQDAPGPDERHGVD